MTQQKVLVKAFDNYLVTIQSHFVGHRGHSVPEGLHSRQRAEEAGATEAPHSDCSGEVTGELSCGRCLSG